MAKKNPFDEFRESTLSKITSGNALKQAVNTSPVQDNDPRVPVRPTEVPVTVEAKPMKKSVNTDRDAMSLHLDQEYKRLLGYLKFDTRRTYNDLINEAVGDLLKKYGKIQ